MIAPPMKAPKAPAAIQSGLIVAAAPLLAAVAMPVDVAEAPKDMSWNLPY